MSIRVFISYSGSDENKAKKLVKELNSNNLEVWFDQEQLFPGDELKSEIKEGIYSSDIFLACISEQYVRNFKGSWTERELMIAITNERKKGVKKIIPVRFEKANGNLLPSILGKRAFADLSTIIKWERNILRLITAINKIANN